MTSWQRVLVCALLMGGAGAVGAEPPSSAPSVDATAPKPQSDASLALAQWSGKHLVMFYRKETAEAPSRLDPAIQAATLALEQEFLRRAYKVTEPTVAAYQALDRGPDVVVTFAADAGPSMIYSVYTSLRPEPGTDVSIAEVRIEARVFLGASLLAAEEGSGQIQVRTDPALRQYGERRGYEAAAKDAAADLVTRVDARLQSLTAAQVAELIAADTMTTSFTLVTPPAPAVIPAPQIPAPAAHVVDTNAPPPLVNTPSTSPPGPSAGKRWLLAIGVSDYSHVRGIRGAGTHDNDLPGTPTDVRNVRGTLNAFGFGDATTLQLFDQTATTDAVRHALQQLEASVQPQDTVVLYITGHGMPLPWSREGMTMPLLYDTDVSRTADRSDLFDFAELATRFSQIPARQLLLVIDTCFSGRATAVLDLTTVTVSSRGVQVARSGGAPDITRLVAAARGMRSDDIAIMTAARPDEASIDLGASVGGLFTSNFVSGLKQTNGLAPIETLYRQYIWSAVVDKSRALCQQQPEESCEQQSPVLSYHGGGNLITLAGD